MVHAVKAAGNTQVQYTELPNSVGKQITDRQGNLVFPEAHENAWITAYSDNGFWRWMFEQHRP